MNLLSRTDVLIGMHGAGWTNGIFIKHGATCLQVRPAWPRISCWEAGEGAELHTGGSHMCWPAHLK